MEQKKQVRISVRARVEFVLRSGDIDNRRSGAAQKDAMAAGTRIHKKIQKRMGGNYRAEVPLKYAALDEEEDIELLVEGRADGIFEEDGIVTIDEIKGVYMDLERLTEPVAVHMAQAMCYGYFYSCDRDLDGVRIQLTYCNLETEEIRRFHEDRSKEELEAWFRSVIHEYFKWARYLCHHELQRNQSISGLEFPFPYREGQRDLAVAVYKTISRKKRLFIQAPTGIGKTLSTIFPAVQAMGAGKASKVFYLTAKTITRTVAEEAFRILRSRGLVFTAVTITAKEKLCPMEKTECNPEACPYAKGHFDRVNEAVFDILHLEQEMDRETVLRYAEKYRVCPFEFCLDISSWTDGIICDYNYVFDPNVRLKRYFADGASGDYLFLVDEAHNLVSRAREMGEAEKAEFLEEFEKERSHSLAAFCVMGGVFSEGIDLKEERLIGVIVVGTGLPMVCVEQEVLKGYFDETEEKGFDFSYQYPGMNKVLQAAGRVIRTPGDRGVILLLDDRFLRRDHLELFPREWEHFQVVNRGNAARCLEDFWNGRGL